MDCLLPSGSVIPVTWKGATSTPHRLFTSVPNSSVLGPLPFYFYTQSPGGVIPSHRFSDHYFAEDTELIISFCPSDTHVLVKTTVYPCSPAESQPQQNWIAVHPSWFIPTYLLISLDNLPISFSVTAHSLGVIMDNRLSFSSNTANLSHVLLFYIRWSRPFPSTQVIWVLVQSLVI